MPKIVWKLLGWSPSRRSYNNDNYLFSFLECFLFRWLVLFVWKILTHYSAVVFRGANLRSSQAENKFVVVAPSGLIIRMSSVRRPPVVVPAETTLRSSLSWSPSQPASQATTQPASQQVTQCNHIAIMSSRVTHSPFRTHYAPLTVKLGGPSPDCWLLLCWRTALKYFDNIQRPAGRAGEWEGERPTSREKIRYQAFA